MAKSDAGRQNRRIDRIAADHRARIERAIVAAVMDAVAVYEETGTVPVIGAARFEDAYADMITAAVMRFAEPVADRREGKGFMDRIAEAARRYISLEAVRRRIVSVAETTRNIIVGQVRRGYDAGLGQRETAKLIREEAQGIAKRRANVIARTETHGASNYGAWVAAVESGLPYRKVWVSVQDDRTRDGAEGDEFDHVAMNGVAQDLKVPFSVPGRNGPTQAMFPGDPDSAPGSCINCRCALTYELALEDMIG